MKTQISPKAFFEQLNQFYRMLEKEHPTSLDNTVGIPKSARMALAFTEKVILCPTHESAGACIRNDLPGAISFLLAARGVQQRLAKGNCRFASESPEHQTIFYVLAGAVQDYLESLYAHAASVAESRPTPVAESGTSISSTRTH